MKTGQLIPAPRMVPAEVLRAMDRACAALLDQASSAAL